MEKEELQRKVEAYSKKLQEVKKEVQKGIVGQDKVIESVLKCLLCNGHVLLEGVPGLAKTLFIRLLSLTVADAKFQRIQFTPDLLPSDIIGVTVYEEKRGFYTIKGPIFANFVCGDEINRTPPKVQSAMLQAMQEREVTIGRQTFPLPNPFFVLATQNPLETKGTYPLPEAQVDRFLFKVMVKPPPKKDEVKIIEQNAEVMEIEEFNIQKTIDLKEILDMQEVVKQISMSEEIQRYIVHLVNSTRYPERYDIEEGRYLQWGASPRASIYLSLTSKATALMNNRLFVIPEDVRCVAHDVLRHRMVLNYEGKAKGIDPDNVVDAIIKGVPVL
ncbi:MAG: MoxR family ATPase [Candidatus Altiarchaeota archaeon]|nr:MoxR family ATPase [Candidatus Altiarchaeota archaeon]